MEAFTKKEEELSKRQKRLDDWENEIKKREKRLKQKEKAKKQIVLRLSPSLWEEVSQWAENDFRSINSQIEYILTEAVNHHKKG